MPHVLDSFTQAVETVVPSRRTRRLPDDHLTLYLPGRTAGSQEHFGKARGLRKRETSSCVPTTQSRSSSGKHRDVCSGNRAHALGRAAAAPPGASRHSFDSWASTIYGHVSSTPYVSTPSRRCPFQDALLYIPYPPAFRSVCRLPPSLNFRTAPQVRTTIHPNSANLSVQPNCGTVLLLVSFVSLLDPYGFFSLSGTLKSIHNKRAHKAGKPAVSFLPPSPKETHSVDGRCRSSTPTLLACSLQFFTACGDNSSSSPPFPIPDPHVFVCECCLLRWRCSRPSSSGLLTRRGHRVGEFLVSYYFSVVSHKNLRGFFLLLFN